jgi:hypothetical protein
LLSAGLCEPAVRYVETARAAMTPQANGGA